MALPLACGLTLEWTGDEGLANWARLGAQAWFLDGPADDPRAATWDVAFERGRVIGPFENPPRWELRSPGEACRTPWGAISLQPRLRRCLIRMPDRHGMGYLIHLALGAMLRHEGRLQLHAAVLAPDAGLPSVVVAGPSGSGKTTLTLSLARRGWTFLSDDSVALSEEPGGFYAAPIRLRFMQAREGGARKCPVDPEAEFPGQRLWRAPVGAVVFVERTVAASCSLSPISRSQALSRLPALIPGFGPDTGRSQIKSLARLAALPAFILHSGADVPSGGSSAEGALRVVLERARTPSGVTIEGQLKLEPHRI